MSIFYIQLFGVIVLGSVLGEIYRMFLIQENVSAKRFLINFILSVFASFMLILFFIDNIESELKIMSLAGLLGLQDYALIHKLTAKILGLQFKIIEKKEGD